MTAAAQAPRHDTGVEPPAAGRPGGTVTVLWLEADYSSVPCMSPDPEAP